LGRCLIWCSQHKLAFANLKRHQITCALNQHQIHMDLCHQCSLSGTRSPVQPKSSTRSPVQPQRHQVAQREALHQRHQLLNVGHPCATHAHDDVTQRHVAELVARHAAADVRMCVRAQVLVSTGNSTKYAQHVSQNISVGVAPNLSYNHDKSPKNGKVHYNSNYMYIIGLVHPAVIEFGGISSNEGKPKQPKLNEQKHRQNKSEIDRSVPGRASKHCTGNIDSRCTYISFKGGSARLQQLLRAQKRIHSTGNKIGWWPWPSSNTTSRDMESKQARDRPRQLTAAQPAPRQTQAPPLQRPPHQAPTLQLLLPTHGLSSHHHARRRSLPSHPAAVGCANREGT
jgi:hypothetical protein